MGLKSGPDTRWARNASRKAQFHAAVARPPSLPPNSQPPAFFVPRTAAAEQNPRPPEPSPPFPTPIPLDWWLGTHFPDPLSPSLPTVGVGVGGRRRADGVCKVRSAPLRYLHPRRPYHLPCSRSESAQMVPRFSMNPNPPNLDREQVHPPRPSPVGFDQSRVGRRQWIWSFIYG